MTGQFSLSHNFHLMDSEKKNKMLFRKFSLIFFPFILGTQIPYVQNWCISYQTDLSQPMWKQTFIQNFRSSRCSITVPVEASFDATF